MQNLGSKVTMGKSLKLKQNKILIMCGGQGKRLGTISKKLPKPLMNIGKRTILEYKLEQYQRQGFNDFIFCVGYKGELIQTLVKQINGIHAEFSDAGESAGILARLFYAKPLFYDQVLMTYGDTFTDLQLSALYSVHQKSNNEATIVVAPIKNPFGLVEFNAEQQVTFFKEKPILNYFIGYAVINKSALELIPDKVINMPDGEGIVTFFKILMGMDLLGCYFHSGLQTTFNTQEEFEKVEQEIINFCTAIEDT